MKHFKFFFVITLFSFNLYADHNLKDGNLTQIKQSDLITYQVQDELMPHGLVGISDEQILDHWQLYKGYVAQVNTLNRYLADLRRAGKGSSLEYADRRRRYGFEYNGMVLHELYFSNLKSAQGDLKKGDLYKAIEKAFASYQAWKQDFVNAGKTRGIGWALLCCDMTTGVLVNIFVDDHQIGQIAGFAPLLVMDVWEHAYMVDHKAGGRADYIDAFMNNINWKLVKKRFKESSKSKIKKRYS